MFSFVPLESYYPLYINICLLLVIFTLFHTWVLKMDNHVNLVFTNIAGGGLLLFITLYIGQREISGIYFGDTINYARAYQKYALGGELNEEGDLGWNIFMKFIASYASISTFFTIIAFLYIFPLYKISVTYFNQYWYYAFIMFLVSFSFWTYGVNGIRNGTACSLFLWGLCYERKKVVMALFFFLAISFHKTLLLPIIAYLVTYIYNNPKFFFYGWVLCIPLSLVAGGFWINLFSSLGFGDDRLSGYLTSAPADGTFSNTGFRWDFLFHSAFAVFAGWYFVLKRKFQDTTYNKLLITYLICNGFWILVITANFSNRFAYLSWFMMAIVIIYPLLKKQFFANQHFIIGKILSIYFSFTYLMFYLYYN
ncbi:EpsG family protein [Muricauda ruestringensis]|uniref:EpsG family protein n=2 Tax=Flagellimonas aurea TaxID=2915619 RepID=A0ABS3G1K7_9FLAO|nr:hypothetical protein [Allomuricauda sp.]MBO0353296.1 EpsG family protein [Allomuricauda aurea]